MIFVGLAFDSDDEENLTCVQKKEDLFPDPNKLPDFDLSKLEKEILELKKHIVSCKVINSEKPKSNTGIDYEGSERFLDGYLDTINATLSSNLRIITEGIEKCYVHAPINEDGEVITVQKSLSHSHPVFKRTLIFQDKNSFNELVHQARLFATYEYLRRRRVLRRHVNRYIENTRHTLLHIVRMLWKSPNVQRYTNSFVGYPEIIVRTRSKFEKIPLILGQKINFFPIARACLGIPDEVGNESCIQSDDRRPFGTIVTSKKFERCPTCRKKSVNIRCIYQHPKCDGSQVLCDNSNFAGNVCNGNFAIYLTIFNDILKVGRAILSRTIGRLLEQSALDGLVFYPVNSIDTAHMIERKVATYLRGRIKHLRTYGINRITTRVNTEDRFKHIKLASEKIGSNDREYVYEQIKRILEKVRRPEIRLLVALQSRTVDLSQNWLINETAEISNANLTMETQFVQIEGKIEGIVGSFVFSNGRAFALNNLQGYVAECH